MSAENVEVVRQFFEVGLDADELVARGVVDPELRFVPGAGSLIRGALSARGFAQVVEDIATQFEEYDVRPERFIDAGESVVVELRRRAIHAGSSVPIEDRFAQVFTFRGGRIVRMQSFFELDDALQAAGIGS